MRSLTTVALTTPFAMLLAGCAVGPTYLAPTAPTLGVPAAWSVPATASREDLAAWWRRFDDPVLSALIDKAMAGNLDIAQAQARLRQAREALVQSRSGLFPTLSASGSGGRNEALAGTLSPTGSGATSLSLGLDASYQADVFGGVRRSVEASSADLAASGFTLAATQLSMESELARNYMQARGFQQQLDLARATLAIQDDNLSIAQFRVQAGLVTSVDVESARASRAQAAAVIPQVEQSFAAAVARIAVLTGEAPGALRPLLATPAPIPTGPANIALGIPADLLRRRPDVLSAERNLAAASARIGVAQARLYPALSFTGSLASSAGAVRTLFDTITGSLFANLAQTLFDGGSRRAQTRSARAGADLAFAAYKSSVLRAIEDTENAAGALDSAEAREVQFALAATAAQNSAILARSQYRAGLTDFTTLNTQESALVNARTSLLQARADKAQALVTLFVALGGGWSGADLAPAAAATPSSSPR
ncbi:efflux transporter outer membrane subunit [Novosphingobium sp. FKTRR1]|uniref:efflux transporter outer membrane subunit n=1 Tax=Novosphingobium sp. FKTRR1 TaxID=2879118 RepID=UPI001CF0496D|nr:efflux transporter outer membrane subunit [Novosphingobium sp. FKTRR1]